MGWKIGSLIGEIALTVWAFLLAYRKIGKRPGENPAFDEWMSSMSGMFKAMGVLGVVVIVLSVIDLAFFR